MIPIQINQNDFGIKLTLYCRDEEGRPIDLSPFNVDLLLYNADVLINDGTTTCTKTEAEMGVAEFILTSTHTQTPALLRGKIKLSNASSQVKNLGQIPIQIMEQ